MSAQFTLKQGQAKTLRVLRDGKVPPLENVAYVTHANYDPYSSAVPVLRVNFFRGAAKKELAQTTVTHCPGQELVVSTMLERPAELVALNDTFRGPFEAARPIGGILMRATPRLTEVSFVGESGESDDVVEMGGMNDHHIAMVASGLFMALEKKLPTLANEGFDFENWQYAGADFAPASMPTLR